MSWFSILKSSAITADFILDVFNVRDEDSPEFPVNGMQGLMGNYGAKHQSEHGKMDKLCTTIGEEITKHGYVALADYGTDNFNSTATYWNANKDYKTQYANYGSTREKPLNLFGHSRPILYEFMQTQEFRKNILPIVARSYYTIHTYQNRDKEEEKLVSLRKRAATKIASALNRFIDEEVNALNKSLLSGTNTGSTSANPANSILLQSVRDLSGYNSRMTSFFRNIGDEIEGDASDWYEDWREE